jgi:hypothetical protein
MAERTEGGGRETGEGGEGGGEDDEDDDEESWGRTRTMTVRVDPRNQKIYSFNIQLVIILMFILMFVLNTHAPTATTYPLA